MAKGAGKQRALRAPSSPADDGARPEDSLGLAQQISGRLSSSVAWVGAGNVVGMILGLAAALLCARLLGPSRFGEYSVVRTTQLLATTVVSAGLAAAAARYVAQIVRIQPAECGRTIATLLIYGAGGAVVLSGAGLIASPHLARDWLNNTELAETLQIALYAILFAATSAIVQGVFLGLQKFELAGATAAAEALLVALGTVVGAAEGGVSGAFWGLFGAVGVVAVAKLVLLRAVLKRRGVDLCVTGLNAQPGLLISFAFPSTLASIVIALSEWLVRLILVRSEGGYAQVAQLAVAHSLATLVLFLPNQVAAPSTSMMAAALADGRIQEFKQIAAKMLRLALWSGALAAAALYLLSDFIISLYGTQFRGAQNVLFILLFAYAVASATVLGSVFSACGLMWWQFGHYCVWASVLVSCALISRPFGAEGVAVAYLSAYSILLLLQTAFYFRLKLRWRLEGPVRLE